MHRKPLRVALVACAAMVVGLGFSGSAHAVAEPDTLDWRQYYPLEVGNVWEWYMFTSVNEHRVIRRQIVSDTLIDTTSYFVQVSLHYQTDHELGEIDLIQSDTVLIRYDEGGSRVVARLANAEGEWSYTCDLSTPFEISIECDETQVYVGGGYTPGKVLTLGSKELAVTAEKSHTSIGGGSTYIYGIGELPMIGEGGYGETRFVWLRLGGEEYGVSLVGIESGDRLEWEYVLPDMYPNPATVRVKVGLPVAVHDDYLVEIYDVLGRSVSTRTRCAGGDCVIDVSLLPAGRYLLRATNKSGTVHGRFVVLR